MSENSTANRSRMCLTSNRRRNNTVTLQSLLERWNKGAMDIQE
ncbi:Uncharacterised protein r2_g2318 [Pycnogonum litorale]